MTYFVRTAIYIKRGKLTKGVPWVKPGEYTKSSKSPYHKKKSINKDRSVLLNLDNEMNPNDWNCNSVDNLFRSI